VPLDDVLATIAWVGGQHPFDHKRVAIMGEGFGGYLALRALQLHPTVFRCAVSINAPLDLAAWTRLAPSFDARFPLSENYGERVKLVTTDSADFGAEARRAFIKGSARPLAELSVLNQVEGLLQPVCLIADPANPEVDIGDTHSLRAKLRRLDRAPDYLEINGDFSRGVPKARVQVYERVARFLDINLYNYKVQIGETKEMK